MTRTTQTLIILAAFALLTGPARAQVVPPAPNSLPAPLTLAQALAIALAHEPGQFAARAQISSALGQRQQAQAQYYPTFTPTYQFQNRRQALFGITTGGNGTTTTTGGTTGTGSTGGNTGGTSPVGGTTSGTTGSTTTGASTTGGTTIVNTSGGSNVSIVRGGGLALSLTQTLFDNGAREAANAQARRAVDAANYGEANTRQATILTVTQDYYQLLAALDQVKVAQAQVDRFQQTLDVTQAQITAGTVAAKELYQARADLASAQVTLLQNRNFVTTNSAALKFAMGVVTSTIVQPAGLATGSALPPLPVDSSTMTLNTYQRIAFEERPDLRQQLANVQSSLSALRAEQRRAGVSISADYVLTYQVTSDTGSRGTNSQLLVTGTYPLFDAGSARGAVRVAQAQLDIQRDQFEQSRQQVHLDVEQSFATRDESLQATRLAQAAVTAAQVNYDSAIESRREGVGTLLDITTAQATLTQAQSQYVSAVYNFYIADAQLQRAIGRSTVPTTP